MPQFVILHHAMPPESARSSHWDFMLEREGGLRTWALAEEPRPQRLIAAERLADHRLDYLTYEGAVSGNRGNVFRWDAGEYRVLEETAERIKVSIDGGRWRGFVILQCASSGEDRQWTFSLSLM